MPLPAFITVKSAEIAIFDRRVENSNTFLQNVLGGCWGKRREYAVPMQASRSNPPVPHSVRIQRPFMLSSVLLKIKRTTYVKVQVPFGPDPNVVQAHSTCMLVSIKLGLSGICILLSKNSKQGPLRRSPHHTSSVANVVTSVIVIPLLNDFQTH